MGTQRPRLIFARKSRIIDVRLMKRIAPNRPAFTIAQTNYTSSRAGSQKPWPLALFFWAVVELKGAFQ